MYHDKLTHDGWRILSGPTNTMHLLEAPSQGRFRHDRAPGTGPGAYIKRVGRTN